MDNKTYDAASQYAKEIEIRLTRAGYSVQPKEDDLLPVDWMGKRICRVSADGHARFFADDLSGSEERDAFHSICDIVSEVSEYMQLIETAPPIKADSLDESYKLLSDYNGAVLAGHPTRFGVQFITWEWNYDHSAMWQGHYFDGDYAGAKRDFALRAGLIDRDMLFSPEQLTEVYRAIHETLDGAYPITVERSKLLESAAEQIERVVPDLNQRVDQSNQRELELDMELNGTGQTMY